MTPVSHGKPCAGNPHARFEEGASAPEEPRRNALLHKANDNTMVIGGDIKELPAEAFCGDGSLVAVRIIPPVREISKGAFKRCSALESVEIEEGVEAIREEAFLDCTNLKRVRLPSSLRLIDNHAFRGCTSLAEIAFPEGFCQLGVGAFAQCDGLKEISLPSSLVKVFSGAFCQCMGLERVHVHSTIESKGIGEIMRGRLFFDFNDVVYCGHEIFDECRSIKEVVFHEGVVGIPISMFTDCTKIETIKLPSTLKYVRARAFESYCGRPIVLPKGVSRVDKNAFGTSNSKAIVPWNCVARGALLRLEPAAYNRLIAFIPEGERRLADPALDVNGFCEWFWQEPFMALAGVSGHEMDILEVQKGHSRLLRSNLLEDVTEQTIQTWLKLIQKGTVEIRRSSDACPDGILPQFFGEILRQDCKNETWKRRKVDIIAAVFTERSDWMSTLWKYPAKRGHLSPMLEAVSYGDVVLHRELELIAELAGASQSLPAWGLRNAAEEGRFAEFMLRLPMYGLEMDRHTIAMLFDCHATKCIVSAYKKYDRLEKQIPLGLVLLAVCQHWPLKKASEFVRFVEKHFPGLCANTVDAAGCSPLWYCLYNSNSNRLEIAGDEAYMRKKGSLVASLIRVGCDSSKMNRFGLSFDDISKAFRSKSSRLITPPTYVARPFYPGLPRNSCPDGFVNAMQYAVGGVIDSWKCARAADIVRLWIPAEVRIIGNCAFRGCENLEEVEFENCGAGEPLAVGLMAFAACPKLSRVHLSERLVSLGDGAFRDCTMLSQFSIPPPHGLIQLGGVHVFDNCPDKDAKLAALG